MDRAFTGLASFLHGGGAMGERIRSHDWCATPLGPPDNWPQGLRFAVRLMLATQHPVLVAWGGDRTLLFNDAYAAALGSTCPAGLLGAPGRETPLWRRVGAAADAVFAGEGEVWHESVPIPAPSTCGGTDGAYWNCSYSPIDDAAGVGGVLVICTETTRAVRAQMRQQFRLALDDALRGLDDPGVVIATATEMLGRHLHVQRCGYAEFDAAGEIVTIEKDWTDDVMPSARGTWRIADFGQALVDALLAGKAVRIEDVLDDPAYDEKTAAAHMAVGGMRAGLSVPIHKEGRLAAGLFVHQTTPRHWTDDDEELLRNVAERVWQAVEQARTQAELREGRAVLDFMLESARIGDWDLDLVNDTARRSLRHDQCFGYTEPVEEWGFETFIQHVHPEDRDDIARQFREALEELKDWHFECRVVWPDSSVHWISAHGSIYRTAEGKPTRMLGIVSDITARKRAETLQAAQRRILELAVQESSLATILDSLLRAIEAEAQSGMLGSILLVDRDGHHLRHGAAPSLPDDYVKAIDGVRIGPNVGSCGTAAYEMSPVFVSDIAQDPRWADFRDLALSHSLRACWSLPIMSTRGAVLGTFAMYYREPREPSQADLELVDITIRSAALVIERKAAEAALRDSEARFHFALDAASAVGTWDWDVRNDRVYADRRFAELYSVDPEKAAAGAPVAEFIDAIHPDDTDRVAEEIQRSLAAASDFRAEYRVVGRDGSVRWVLARGHSYNDRGEPARFPGVVLDITERKRGETYRQALIELTDQWRDMTDPADIAFAAAEMLGTTLEVSRAGYGTIDTAAETVTIERDWNAPGVRSLAGTLHFRDYGSYIDDLKRGETVVFADAETDPRTAGTADALKAISARAIVNMPVSEQGGLVALLYLNHRTVRTWTEAELDFVREVAARTRTAVERARGTRALHESEALFRGLAEATPGFLWTANASGAVEYVSQRWAEYSGDGEGRALGAGWATFIHPDDRERTWSIWSAALEHGHLYEAEFRLRRQDGVYRWWLVRAVPLRSEVNAAVRWIGSAADINEIVQAREVLARSREQLERAVEERTAERDRLWKLSRDPFLIADTDGRWLSVSPGWTELLGWSEQEMLGRSPEWMEHPDDRDRTREMIAQLAGGARTVRYENRFRARDNLFRWISWTAVSEGSLIYAVARDVTAEKEAAAALRQAEEQLRQGQKMEAVGQLTGGIAHDFNNMLAVVISSLNLLERRVGIEDDRARRFLEAAVDAARRAASLTQRLLAFSRQQPLRPEPVDVNRVVTGMKDLLRHSLGVDVRLETILADELWRTHIDPNQFENALLNLAVNAGDAMPDGGRLVIETRNAAIDPIRDEVGITAGDYIVVTVSDTGSGMSAEVIARAFDPFFTTKSVGKGTGLGLSQVYGFVRQSGGHVKIESEVGNGTTVTVYLPRLLQEAEPVTENETAAGFPEAGSQEVVLVVEDDDAVRQTSVDALEELGYRVLEADGAAAALRLLDSHPEIALLFTDVVMPEVNGAELAEEALRRRPGLKVLMTTGYARNAAERVSLSDPAVPLIRKPFTLDNLAGKVREALSAPAT